VRYGEGFAQAGRWVHEIAGDLRAGKVQEIIARLQRVRPKTPELREKLRALIRYYRENAGRMRYDAYLRLGYGIGSGAVESAHKQVVHARLRQAGMRWYAPRLRSPNPLSTAAVFTHENLTPNEYNVRMRIRSFLLALALASGVVMPSLTPPAQARTHHAKAPKFKRPGKAKVKRYKSKHRASRARRSVRH
jgi:hypothetical protein